MSIEVADEVVRLVNSGLVTGVSFFGGEPMFNWPIVKYILERTYLEDIWRKKQPFYFITTNGTLFTPAILDFLKKRRVFINLSFDGTKKTQDYWRGSSYDAVVKNLDLLVKHPWLQVLKTLATPSTLYEDLKHIKDLGFRNVFMNLLDPFSHFTYEGCDEDDFKLQYRRAIEELRSKDFRINDYNRWARLIRDVHEGKKKQGCGFTNQGLSVGPDGRMFPCHQAPLNDCFEIGTIWDGIDKEKERKVREVENSPLCSKCVYKFNKCPHTMYTKYGHFGENAPVWNMKFELAKIRVIEEMEGLPHLPAACEEVIK